MSRGGYRGGSMFRGWKPPNTRCRECGKAFYNNPNRPCRRCKACKAAYQLKRNPDFKYKPRKPWPPKDEDDEQGMDNPVSGQVDKDNGTAAT